jgi:hypothetical protein
MDPSHLSLAGTPAPTVRYHVRALDGVILAGGTGSHPHVHGTGYEHTLDAKLRAPGWWRNRKPSAGTEAGGRHPR